MRPTVKPEGMAEHLALWGNLGPAPAAEAMFEMGGARVIMAGVRLGLYGAVAHEPRTAAEVAAACGLAEAPTAHILDCLAAIRHLTKRAGRYRLTRRAARWLDPASPTYIGGFIEFNYDQWEWWSRLEEVARTGQGFDIHAAGPDDPSWRRYITAMFQLARLSAPEVARALRLPPRPTALLDLAGGHGWFAAELCRRHPTLSATVLDLPGSAAIGRTIICEQGMTDRVRHVEGDMMTADLGGPYDGALCFQIIHHLSPEHNVALLRRVHDALRPGGIVAVLDYFARPAGRLPDEAAFLGLHFCLTSSAATYTADDLQAWFAEAGFAPPRRVPLRRVPVQTLYEARRR